FPSRARYPDYRHLLPAPWKGAGDAVRRREFSGGFTEIIKPERYWFAALKQEKKASCQRKGMIPDEISYYLSSAGQ
ncbi:MAG: hypothetical protein WBJ51_05370, partial [Methanoculleus sp.]